MSLVTAEQHFCQGLPTWGQGLGTEKRITDIYWTCTVLDTVGEIGVTK